MGDLWNVFNERPSVDLHVCGLLAKQAQGITLF